MLTIWKAGDVRNDYNAFYGTSKIRSFWLLGKIVVTFIERWVGVMQERSAIKNDLFAPHQRAEQMDQLGDPMIHIEACIAFKTLPAEIDGVAPRGPSPKGGRPPFPTETMVRFLVLKRLNNHSDQRMEYFLLDRLSYQRFCSLTQVLNIPDRTTLSLGTGLEKLERLRCSRRPQNKS